MKVIQKGPGRKNWSKEYKCAGEDGCGATLLVEWCDLYQTQSLYIDMRGEAYSEVRTIFRCCECGNETTIPKGDYTGGARIPTRDLWASANGFDIRDDKIVNRG